VRARLRELADREVGRRTARIDAVARDLDATRAAEDAARAVPTVTAGSAIVLAWAYADALARRAIGLLDDRVRAVTAAEGAREAGRERRRDEEQLARLAARARARGREEAVVWARTR
jgi:hypothetical protein